MCQLDRGMLPLKDCTEQQQYRIRCETGTEAVRPAITNLTISDSPLRMKLMSLKSKDTAKIRFHNTFERQVRALWMDFHGHEVMPRCSRVVSVPCCSHCSMHADTHSNRAGLTSALRCR